VSRKPLTDVSASVHQRLRNLARQQGEDVQVVVDRYAVQRLLYRLAQSEFRDLFVLKGAQLCVVWAGTPHRVTRDLDLEYLGPSDATRLQALFREVCAAPAAPADGIAYIGDSIRSKPIRERTAYPGISLRIEYRMGTLVECLRVDIGAADAITPAPEVTEVPSLLGFPAARLAAYRRETVVAEKFETMVVLGIRNSRMRDFYDLWVLCRDWAFEGPPLCQAIQATFRRRQTAVPGETPVALSQEFATDPAKRTEWEAFLSRTAVRDRAGLAEVVSVLNDFLMPPSAALNVGQPFEMVWDDGRRWHATIEGPPGRST